jgi:hypothetical protein
LFGTPQGEFAPFSLPSYALVPFDRHSDAYQQIYNQRTACERILSQAVAVGIEGPKLRNQRLNTLIYVTLNLRACQRVLELKAHSTPK